MKVEIVTFDADPEHGGFGARVYALVRMFAAFADVRVVLTDWDRGDRVPGVRYDFVPVADTFRSKLWRLVWYYKTDFPPWTPGDRPDLVVVETLDLAGMVPHGGDVPLILDEHNVYWDLLRYDMTTSPFFQTRMGRNRVVRRLLTPYLLSREKAFELRTIRRAATTLVTSPMDRDILLAALPGFGDRIQVIPNCVDLDRIRYVPGTSATSDVLFVGNFAYTPNREAAFFVSRDLAPRLPGARFVLAGAHPQPEVQGNPRIHTPGYVEDLNPLLASARVCIAPLIKGSGTRLKILTYLAAGKPVVATRKACEGLAVEDGAHLLLRDDATEFAAAVQALLRDADWCRRLGEAGRRFVETTYDWRVYVPLLKAIVERALAPR